MADADELRRIAATLAKFLCSDAGVLREIAARLDGHRCDTCRWWQPPEPEFVAGLCLRTGQDDAKFGPAVSRVTIVESDPDFGCVQREAK